MPTEAISEPIGAVGSVADGSTLGGHAKPPELRASRPGMVTGTPVQNGWPSAP